MNLDLGIVEKGSRAEANSTTGSESPMEGSRFSSLLARQMGQIPQGRQNQGSAETSPRGNENSDESDREQIQEKPRETSEDRDSRGDTRSEKASSSPALPAPGTPENGSLDANPLMTGITSLQNLAWPVPTSDAAGLMITGTGSSLGTTDMALTLQSRLAGQIAARFSDQNGIQNLSLKLNPGHLGKVEVTMQAKGDHLSVQITAGNKNAETALRENLRDLTDAIQQKTGRFQQVEVKVDLKSGDGADQHEPDKDESQQDGRQPRDNGQEDQTNKDPNRDSAEREFAAEPGMRTPEG